MDLQGLNKRQLEAVKMTEGPVMVLAGAGSGKTRILTYRIAYIISELGVAPFQILALTFTNKAANEMKERVEKLIKRDVKDLWISTFHSFGARFLRKEINYLDGYSRNFQIIDDLDQEKIVKTIIKEKEYSYVDLHMGLSYLYHVKNNESIAEFQEKSHEFELFYNDYQDYMMKNNLLDFDDLLFLTYRILHKYEVVRKKYQQLFEYILVDEFQDTNKIQFQLIALLTNEHNNIFVVGDMNQSIYSFRGARIQNISQFAKDYHIEEGKNLIKLEENYRSTKKILDVANHLIKKNNSFTNMHLYTSLEEGKDIQLFTADTNYGEVRYVISEIKKLIKKGYKYSDIAILYRINSLSLSFETEFVKEQIPYVIYGGVGYFSRSEVKNVIAYLRLLLNENDDFSFKRIVNVPKRKIGDKQIDSLEFEALKKDCSLYNAIDKSMTNLYQFKLMIEEIKEDIDKLSLPDLIDRIIKRTGYFDNLKLNQEDDRIDNILELKTIMRDLEEQNEGKTNHEILDEFLSDLALKTDVDNIKEDMPKVKLMSFHQAKGLEYKVVFMVAMEQGIFPSVKSMYQNSELEEERRICYVGITRAKEILYLTNCVTRRLYGQDNNYSPSQFLKETGLLTNKQITNTSYKKKIETAGNNIDVGDTIMHKFFGKGFVVAREDEVITVAFGVEHGIRKLIRSHPTITKVEK